MARRVPMIVGALFGGVGLIILIVGVVLTVSAVGFRADAESATGTVVEVVSDVDCDDGRCRDMYTPVVEFSTTDGETVQFAADYQTSTEPAIGSTVEVLYPPSDPDEARVDTFMGFWFGPVMFCGLGGVFTIAGTILLVVQVRSSRRRAWLQSHGQRVTAELVDIRLNRQVRINRRHPWQVVAGWTDPRTGHQLQFVSDNLMDDPRPALDGERTVDVLIDPDDPARTHHVDLTSYALPG
jgi:hypothetical protein